MVGLEYLTGGGFEDQRGSGLEYLRGGLEYFRGSGLEYLTGVG